MGYNLGLYHNEQHANDYTGPKANPYVAPPPMYSPRLAVDQKTTFNPMSTSLNYLARFGTAKHF